MNYTEVRSDLRKDIVKIGEIVERIVSDIKRPKLIRDKFPGGLIITGKTYSSKITKNKYTIALKVIYKGKRHLVSHNIVLLKILDSHGKPLWIHVDPKILFELPGTTVVDGEITTEQPVISVYTPHFADRYNERFLHSQGIDHQAILENFLFRNRAKIIFNPKEKWKYETDDLIGYMGKVNDGIALGMEKDQGFTQWNTFISKEMLRNGQHEIPDSAWEKLMEFVDPLNS